MMLEISLLSILDCFNSDKDGRPTAVKSEIKEFFKSWKKLSTAFITILRYCIPMCTIRLTCPVKEGNHCLYKNIYLL